MQIQSFEPISNDKSVVLILGTMPGIASLNTGEYYGHKDNLFWDIIFRVCSPEWKNDELVMSDFETKKELLLDNGIALWDVLQFCDRKGSLDKDIKNKIHNDFDTFFLNHQSIKTVFFNGKKAAEYFKDCQSSLIVSNEIQFITLPSTSPSNTTNSFFILKEWTQIRNFIKK
jgi:hypoxanthine-DNA glycosylase